MAPPPSCMATAEMQQHPSALSTSAPRAMLPSSVGSPGRPPTPTHEANSHQRPAQRSLHPRVPDAARPTPTNQTHVAAAVTATVATAHPTTATTTRTTATAAIAGTKARARVRSGSSTISTPASTVNAEAPWHAAWEHGVVPMAEEVHCGPSTNEPMHGAQKRAQHRLVPFDIWGGLGGDGLDSVLTDHDRCGASNNDTLMRMSWTNFAGDAMMQGGHTTTNTATSTTTTSDGGSATVQATDPADIRASLPSAVHQEPRAGARSDSLWLDMEATAREVVLGSLAEGPPSAQAAAALTPLGCDPLNPYEDTPIPRPRTVESPMPSRAFVANTDEVPPDALASLVSWLGQGLADTPSSEHGPSSTSPTPATDAGAARSWLPSFPTFSSGCPNPPEALCKEPRFERNCWRVDAEEGSGLGGERQSYAAPSSKTQPPLMPLNPLPTRKHAGGHGNHARRKARSGSDEGTPARERRQRGQRKRNHSDRLPASSSSSLLRTSADSSPCSSGAPNSPSAATTDRYRRQFTSHRRVNPNRTSSVRTRSSARTRAAGGDDAELGGHSAPPQKAARLHPYPHGQHFDHTLADAASTDTDGNDDSDHDHGGNQGGDDGPVDSDSEWLPASQRKRAGTTGTGRSPGKRPGVAKAKKRKSKGTGHRRRRKPVSRTSKPGTRPTSASQPICPICKGIGRNSSKRICGICYSGLYNDVSKIVRAKLKFPLTDNEATNRRKLKKVLKELPRGCKKSYKCTEAAWKYSVSPSAKCTRCRSIHIIDKLPELANLTMNTLL